MNKNITIYTLDTVAGASAGNIPFIVVGGEPNTSFEITLDSHVDEPNAGASSSYITHAIGNDTNAGFIEQLANSNLKFDDNGHFKFPKGFPRTSCGVAAHAGSSFNFKLYVPATNQTVYFTINWI